MKTRSRLLAILAVVAGLASIELLSFHQSYAQVDYDPDTYCVINLSGQCLDCDANPMPGFGCTAHIPANWQEGTCLPWGLGCTQWTNYNCGQEIACAWSLPTEQPCNPVTLCR